ncbi:hypothetical protein ACFQ6O_19410, partial [Streptomyces sp. NPDC056441]
TDLARGAADGAAAVPAVLAALAPPARCGPAGQPRDPKGWLVTVAWRKFLDATRRQALEAPAPENLGTLIVQAWAPRPAQKEFLHICAEQRIAFVPVYEMS